MKRPKINSLFDEAIDPSTSQWLHWEEMPEFKHKAEHS